MVEMISEAQLEFWIEFARKMNEALGPYVVDETRRVEEAARTVLKVFRPDRDRLTREQWRALEQLEEALYGGQE